jgi:plastocyanin
MRACIPYLAAGAAALSSTFVQAGPDKIAFPDKYTAGVLYATVDRPDNKQYRELYATPEAVKAVREGRPIPSGTVLTMVQYKAQLDPQGNPIKDANGRYVKGDVAGYAVMEKRNGWGTEYPDTLRNGEWEYSSFTPDKAFNAKANFKGCFECHKPHEKQDFVISLAQLAGKFPTAEAKQRSGAGDVNIVGFSFGPTKVAVQPGQAVTWLNTDGSPHQISVQGRKTGVLLKGQSESLKFDQEGLFDYVCSLHPAMKGQVEVKK